VIRHGASEKLGVRPANKGAAIAYRLGRSLYLNISSSCTLACTFCPKFRSWELESARAEGGPINLGLGSFKPDAQMIVDAALMARGDPFVSAADVLAVQESGELWLTPLDCFEEVVFVGFGEPTQRWTLLLQTAERLRDLGARRLRLDTDGLASLRQGRDVVPELAEQFDAVSVSVNAQDPATYIRYCPNRYGEAAWKAAWLFLRTAAKSIPWVRGTAVDLPGVDAERCRRLCESLDASFQLRPLDVIG
jgi:GTP 3',8-cyclase